MATVAVAHRPELTREGALEVFRRHLGDRYDVHAARGLREKWLSGRPHLVVRKTQWAAVAVWLRQNQMENTTSFRFWGMIPLPPIVLLGVVLLVLAAVGGREPVVGVVVVVAGILIAYLIARLLLWKAIEADIALVLESASEFNWPGEEPRAEVQEQLFQRGRELGDKGRWQEAIAEFDKAITMNPNYGDALDQRGFAYAELGEVNRALADMERAIALTGDPDTIADIEADIEELRKRAEHTAPKNSDWHWMFAWIPVVAGHLRWMWGAWSRLPWWASIPLFPLLIVYSVVVTGVVGVVGVVVVVVVVVVGLLLAIFSGGFFWF